MSKNLLQNRLVLAEYARNIYSATPEASVSFDDITKPEYWSHVARDLKPGTRIEVTPEDTSWFAELLVRSNTNTSVQVSVLRYVKLDEPKAPADNGDPYEIRHRGGAGWSVIRKADKTVVFDKGQSRAEAERYLEAELA